METLQPLNSKFNLAATVDYNAERVAVTRLMQTPCGDINVIAMTKGQKLDRHTAPGAVLIQVLEGEVEFILEDKPLRLSAGEAFLMEAGTPHSVTAPSSVKFLLTKLDN